MQPKSHQLQRLLEDASLLQAKVQELVLVGGSVAAFYAEHRESYDHDHVLEDLQERLSVVLEALEADPEYLINRVTPGKIILGEHNGIEYGIRQLLRARPLEVTEEYLPSGNKLVVPTLQEALRIKAYLLVKRNQTRDYLDVAALSDRIGIAQAARVLIEIDAYYQDPNQEIGSVATQLVTMLLEPKPIDVSVTKNLRGYKSLASKWHNWNDVAAVLSAVAGEMGASA
jgi:hypothetical protein